MSRRRRRRCRARSGWPTPRGSTASSPSSDPITQFSNNGDEVTWATIGNASTAEGLFWEVGQRHRRAASPGGHHHLRRRLRHLGPQPVPDGQGKHRLDPEGLRARSPAPPSSADRGFDLYSVRGWDYPALLETYAAAARDRPPRITSRRSCTSPKSPSRRGTPPPARHERYKSPERLAWEAGVRLPPQDARSGCSRTSIATAAGAGSPGKPKTRETVEDAAQSRLGGLPGAHPAAEREQLLDLLEAAGPVRAPAPTSRRSASDLSARPAPVRSATCMPPLHDSPASPTRAEPAPVPASS